jgi:phage anti-repressor protein
MKGLKLIQNQLIPVYENKRQEQIVDGRELHTLLKVQTRFNDWISRKIKDYDFIEGEDFYSYLSKSKGGRKATEYALKIDVAKEIAMVESNEIGRKIRKYFIQVEKLWREELSRRAIITEAKAEFPEFTQAILMAHDEPKHYHFSNEIDMINRIALGMSAKQFKEAHNLGKVKSIRPYLSTSQIEAIRSLQRIDIGLVVAVPDFQERKRILTDYHSRQLAPAALA